MKEISLSLLNFPKDRKERTSIIASLVTSVTFMVFLVMTVHILLLYFIDDLCILSFYMRLGVGLSLKQRQRKDTDGLH